MNKELNKLIEVQKEYFMEKRKDFRSQDYNMLKKANLKMNILVNNIINMFIVEDYDKIINTLKKYQNKRIGEKTREKIEEDIKSINNLYEFVHIHSGYNSWDSNNWTLSIELKNETFTHSRAKIKLEFKYYKNAYEETEGYFIYINGYSKDKYIYRTDIDTLANNIINDYNKTRQEIEELKKQANSKMDSFKEKYPYCILGDSQRYYEFKHI